MSSIINRTFGPVLSFDSMNRMNDFPINDRLTGSSLNGRLVANASNCDCLSFVREIFKAIGDFFVHRYADCHLFWRSFTSMGHGTSWTDYVRRETQLRNFLAVLEMRNGNADRNEVSRSFQSLPAQARNLFFYVDQNYIREFAQSQSNVRNFEMRLEMIRECDQVIAFQRQLSWVNVFYRLFSNRTHPQFSVRTIGTAPTRGTTARRNGVIEPLITIPQEVQNKANEIQRLREKFAELPNPPHVPDVYHDSITMDFFSLPIYDASHPAVQNDPNDRSVRHLIEKDSLEEMFRNASSWAPTKCPFCRHPEDGGIRRENLRIDTALQDEILQFLRNATRSSEAATV